MLKRGTAQLEAIAALVEVFGHDADKLVIFGSCALALYARPEASSDLRSTKDVDCILTMAPLAIAQARLAKMCEQGMLIPIPEFLCRYRIRQSNTIVDVLDIEGRTVGRADPWLQKSVEHAGHYWVHDNLWVNAITPPYFLAMKLSALIDRGPDEMSVDAEDIITLALEVNDLLSQVCQAGLHEEIKDLFKKVQQKYSLSSFVDLVDYHIHPQEREHFDRVCVCLLKLAS